MRFSTTELDLQSHSHVGFWTLQLEETVGSQFLSLRQSYRNQHSPVACERAQKPNNHGLRAQTSGLLRMPSPSEPRSLRGFFSESPRPRRFGTVCISVLVCKRFPLPLTSVLFRKSSRGAENTDCKLVA